jgi:hypothetical protein
MLSGEAVLEPLQSLGQTAGLSSRAGSEPARAKATKGQAMGTGRFCVKK